MADHLSRTQAEKLGKRLAAADPSVDDLRLLEQWRAQHGPALHAVEEGLRRLGLEPTSRPKTTGTIVEKLRREAGMSLSRMEDIAGVRVVRDMTRSAQDEVVERIVALFPEAKVKDRREMPSFGYRAVHVIVKLDAYLVEVQVRTALQNLWAQMLERLADQWGRQMRYGGEPEEPDALAAPRWTRRDVAEYMQLASDYITLIEEAEVLIEGGHQILAEARGTRGVSVEREATETQLGEWEITMDTKRRGFYATLRLLAETFGVEVP